MVLSGDVYIDETFFTVEKTKIVKKNGKKLRGISRNKICVATGVCNNCSLFLLTKVSKLNEEAAFKAYRYHIKPNSHIIHDSEKSHNILIRELNLESSTYDSKAYKNVPDKDNPLAQINKVHRLLKDFMGKHGGFKRKELQDWLNLFWFISNGPEDRYDKVLLFIELAINKRKMLRFRECFKKKE